ncbi:hypothetical protein BGZ83_004327, partial [Gryganskiella cystojenkinii]
MTTLTDLLAPRWDGSRTGQSAHTHASADLDTSSSSESDSDSTPSSSSPSSGSKKIGIDSNRLMKNLQQVENHLDELMLNPERLVQELWQRRKNDVQFLIADHAQIQKQLGHLLPYNFSTVLSPCRIASAETAELQAKIKKYLPLDKVYPSFTAGASSLGSKGLSQASQVKQISQTTPGPRTTVKKQDQQASVASQALTSGRLIAITDTNPYESRTDFAQLRKEYKNLHQLAIALCQGAGCAMIDDENSDRKSSGKAL